MPVKHTSKARKLTAADLKKISGGASAAVAKGKSSRPSISGGKSAMRATSTSARGR